MAGGAAIGTGVGRLLRHGGGGRGRERALRQRLLLVVLVDGRLDPVHDLREPGIVGPFAAQLDDGPLRRGDRSLRIEEEAHIAQDLPLVTGEEQSCAAELRVLREIVGARDHPGLPGSGIVAHDEIDVLHSLRQLPRLFEAQGDERHDDVRLLPERRYLLFRRRQGVHGDDAPARRPFRLERGVVAGQADESDAHILHLGAVAQRHPHDGRRGCDRLAGVLPDDIGGDEFEPGLLPAFEEDIVAVRQLPLRQVGDLVAEGVHPVDQRVRLHLPGFGGIAGEVAGIGPEDRRGRVVLVEDVAVTGPPGQPSSRVVRSAAGFDVPGHLGGEHEIQIGRGAGRKRGREGRRGRWRRDRELLGGRRRSGDRPGDDQQQGGRATRAHEGISVRTAGTRAPQGPGIIGSTPGPVKRRVAPPGIDPLEWVPARMSRVLRPSRGF